MKGSRGGRRGPSPRRGGGIEIAQIESHFETRSGLTAPVPAVSEASRSFARPAVQRRPEPPGPQVSSGPPKRGRSRAAARKAGLSALGTEIAAGSPKCGLVREAPSGGENDRSSLRTFDGRPFPYLRVGRAADLPSGEALFGSIGNGVLRSLPPWEREGDERDELSH